MKITENPDGTYTLDPRPGVAVEFEFDRILDAAVTLFGGKPRKQ